MKKISDYWDKKAKQLKQDPAATMGDVCLRELEINSIVRQLKKTDEVLDVGCGNGFTTAICAEKVKSIIGIDFSEEMINQSNQVMNSLKKKLKNIKFRQMDILNLEFEKNSFDAAISERCLINVQSWQNQKKALLQLKKVIKPKGFLLMIEGTTQGLACLNKARKKIGLHEIKKHWHNVLFDKKLFNRFIKRHFKVIDIQSFGSYYFISRIVHPLLVMPKEPRFKAKINQIARKIALEMPAFNDISINNLYILQPKK
ncbi:MAG: class I SAM-dependent methyltransferase [Candidatus Omnitrophica bacterium]|nr:class I SAM-dependent methyltransferase [Candidatus Omnitrophota bacterium]